MPAMANITVKNKANADVIYVAATPSAGDKSPAKWRQNAASGVIGWRPSLDVTTRDNANRNGRHMSGVYKFPITGVVNGETKLLATVPFSFDGTLPTNVDSAQVDEAFVQFGNLLASALVRSIAAEGYSAT